ncbi:MAG: BrnT family toxin [Candidatus Methanoperedens sp.]|nr:BrnT family toxin [Candidatus Methanoperedens sp.]
MQIKEIMWIERFVTKIIKKHNATNEEVEEALHSDALFRRAKKGKVKGEDVYVAYGRTVAGRYLFIVFIYKSYNIGLIISARDMTDKERKYYHAKKT